MRLIPNTQSTVLSGPFVSAGGATADAFTFTSASALTDTNNIESAYSVSNGFTYITLANPSTVSKYPSTGASFSMPLRDIFGDVKAFYHGDILQMIIWTEDALLPADACIGVTLTKGAASSTSYGFGCRLHGNSTGTGNFTSHITNDGSAWSESIGTNANSSARGAKLDLTHRAQNTQYTVQAAPIDATGLVLSNLNTGTVPSTLGSANIYLNLDTITVFAGWYSGSGGSAGVVVKPKIAVAFIKVESLPGASI